jgi:hypothetical protein
MKTLTDVQRLVDQAQLAFNARDKNRVARNFWPQIKATIYELDLPSSVQTGLMRSLHTKLDSLQPSSPPIEVYKLLKEDTKREIPIEPPQWLPF